MHTRIYKEALEGHMDKHLTDRICKLKTCKKRFTPSRFWQWYCCTECHDLYWKNLRAKAAQIDRCGGSKGQSETGGD